MSDPTNNSEEILRKLSRRNMLRNSAITAAGAILMPPFLTGCHKDVWDKVKEHIPGGGLGGALPEPEPTLEELQAAAGNLKRMQDLLYQVYHNSFDYDETVYKALAATDPPSTWTNFIVDVFIDVGIAMLATAAAASGPAAFALWVPALAGASAFLHDWQIGKDKPVNLAGLNGEFARYQTGQLAMRDAIDKHLSHLTSTHDNYANLRAAWKDPIAGFNPGEQYTLQDLAKSHFPDKHDDGDEYFVLYETMYLHHQKAVWNLMIMKCCGYWQYYGDVQLNAELGSNDTFTKWAQREFYPKHKGVYLRGKKSRYSNWYSYSYWNLGIGDNPFPDAASEILFIDDTPGHIINPNGLFNRSYVFEQFSPKKYRKLLEYHEIATNPNEDFATLADDWRYTGGMFNRLVEVDPA